MKGRAESPYGLTSRDLKLLWRSEKSCVEKPTELCTLKVLHPSMLVVTRCAMLKVAVIQTCTYMYTAMTRLLMYLLFIRRRSPLTVTDLACVCFWPAVHVMTVHVQIHFCQWLKRRERGRKSWMYSPSTLYIVTLCHSELFRLLKGLLMKRHILHTS